MKNEKILNTTAPCRFNAEKVRDTIQQIAEEVGFDLVGIANAAIGNEIACPNDHARMYPFGTGGHSVGRASSAPLPRNDNAGDGLAITGEKLDEWIENGYHADMKWFAETVEKRRDILKVMSEAKSVICVAMNYYSDDRNKDNKNKKEKNIKNAITHSSAIADECVIRNSMGFNEAVGKIARYARGRPARTTGIQSGGDYHKIFDKKLKLFIKRLEEEILLYSQNDKGKELKFKYYSDTGPVLERAWAVRAGLGFIGKNTNLITKYGSWVLLGEIIMNVELKSPRQFFSHQTGGDLTPPASDKCSAPLRTNSTSPLNDSKKTAEEISQQNNGGCGSCRRCLDACPTGALATPYTVDARKCISYLTIEHKGEIPMELREKMGNRIFGCDACQEVCPFNIGRQKEADNELTQKAIAGTSRDLKEILLIKTDEEFLNKFAGSPLMRAKRRGLVRNACIAAGNLGDENLLPYLEECLKDKDVIIVEAAGWAVKKLKKEI